MAEADTSARRGGRVVRWEALDHPAIWLAYLPLFFVPWAIKLPNPAQMVWAVIGLAVFLGIYFLSLNAAGWRLIALAVAALLLSFALAFTNSNWTVIAVYAAAMIAELRPAWRASLGVGAFAAASAGLALATGQPAIYWVLGVFLMIMVGIGNISRAALQDKNAALAAAQGEVRQFAAAVERERIGRDLHDLLGRTLTLIALKADLAARLADSAPDKAADEMRDVAAAARGQMHKTDSQRQSNPAKPRISVVVGESSSGLESSLPVQCTDAIWMLVGWPHARGIRSPARLRHRRAQDGHSASRSSRHLFLTIGQLSGSASARAQGP